jgi:hypothetical protein
MSLQTSTPQPLVPADEDEAVLFSEATPTGWHMRQLKPKHKNIAALIAQGLPYVQIAKLMDVTPVYVSMLSRQPLMKAYIAEMCEITGVRLEAMFEKVVDTIAETLEGGTEAGKLKAARLALEVQGRVGARDAAPRSGNDSVGRLERLAERLIYLQSGQRPPGVYSENGEAITDAEFSESVSSQGPESA